MSDSALPGSFFLSILTTLEELDIPYFVVGGFAAIAFGVSRVTYDVDIVGRFEKQHVRLLTNRYPLPRYYADPYQMDSSIAMGIPFNIIDTRTGEKADLIPATERENEPFQRRVRQRLTFTETFSFDVWCASPEDVILGKLRAWAEVTSRKHERDILEIVVATLKATPARQPLDPEYIDAQARQINSEAHALWRAIVEQARRA